MYGKSNFQGVKYWVGPKDTFFIFTNNFVNMDILSMLAISYVVEHLLFSINVSI